MNQHVLVPGSNQAGKGSTTISFQLERCNPIAAQPQRLFDAIGAIIQAKQLVLREITLLDYWDTAEAGSSTVFRPLAESHVHIFGAPRNDSWVRAETWPEFDNHANGNVQLCNYSRNNRYLTAEVFCDIAEMLQPEMISFEVMQFGPRMPMKRLTDVVHVSPRYLRQQFNFLKEPMSAF